MQVFVVLPSDLDENDWAYIDEDRVKCGGCLWDVSRLYVLANSKQEAIRLVKKGEAGLCGECFMEMVVENAWQIISEEEQKILNFGKTYLHAHKPLNEQE
jgi:hypothetical protein